ncbi:MAG: heme-binding protein [Acidobacteriota bacterium]
MPRSSLLITGIVVVASIAARAQTPPTAATQVAPAKPFALSLALEAAQAALGSCQASGVAAVVEVMDTAFNPKVILAADGTRANLVEFARRKAYTVIKTGMSSAEFGTSVGPQPRGGPPINGDANLITFGGGLPIKVNDDIVAALSVSGPTGPAADETCAKAGLDKIRDRLK